MSHTENYNYHKRRVRELRERACGFPSKYEQEDIAYHVGRAWVSLIEAHKEQGKPYNATELLEQANA